MAGIELSFGKRSFSLDFRATKISGHPRDPAIAQFFAESRGDADAGTFVTPDTAMRSSAVYAAVRLLSRSVAMLPPIIYKRLPNGDRERDPTHPLQPIIKAQPNRYQTSFQFYEMMMGHLLLRGNAYALIVPSGTQAVAELMPLHPDRVKPFWAPDGRRAYEFMPLEGGRQFFLQDEMLHVMGISFDGLRGLNPIEHHRVTVGLDLAAKMYGDQFFRNDATPGIVLTHPGKPGNEATQNILDSWRRDHAGVIKSHRVGLLKEGMTIAELGMNQEDAQYIETRKFEVNDIARIFGVPPHMIGDLEKATFSNIEEQSLEYVVYSLTPWLAAWEQEYHWKLFTDASKRINFVEFLVDALLRGDTKSRFEALFRAGGGPWMTRDEIRKIENLPSAGLDEVLRPVNMVPEGEEGGAAAQAQRALAQARQIIDDALIPSEDDAIPTGDNGQKEESDAGE